ncbi:MAG: hypothetical protein LUE64_01815 [Candidatus Gastranaerophilales bacterium]|nr:hypothetical protein [Candidatus Gastranaerophilales bacterium]
MLASILNFILFLVFIYLILYGVYLFTVNLKAFLSAKKFLSGNAPKISDTDKKNRICVIIFANSKSKRLEPLLQAVNNQTYDKQNYSCQVVFAKDSNSLMYTPDCMAGAQIHCIENPEYFTKNKALNLFTEKLLVTSKFDVFVFLGADRMINSSYLSNINAAFNKPGSGIYTGRNTVIPLKNDKSLKSNVISAKQNFKNNTVFIARRMFDLASVIDSENCAISADILEKTGRVCLETPEDELKYSLFLASNGIKPVFSPYIETFTDARHYNPTTAGIGLRISLFKYYLKLLIGKPWYFIEFTLSLLQPNVAVVILLYLTLCFCSFKFISSIGMKYILHLGIFYLFVWILGLTASKFSLKKILFFAFYPFYSLGLNFKKMTGDISKKALKYTISEEKNVKSATLDTYVTDGTKNVMCKMDLISDDGMRRVILRFRKKRLISDESIRMCDAVSNISKKVSTHGLSLKVCQNCKYFKALQDGTVDLLKGTCCRAGDDETETFETLIWNNCNYFIPAVNNIIENFKK